MVFFFKEEKMSDGPFQQVELKRVILKIVGQWQTVNSNIFSLYIFTNENV